MPSYDPRLFEAIAAVEGESFWFRARNRLIVSTLRRWFPEAQSLLEVGCGTGFVLAGIHEALPQLRLVGSELHGEGLAVARRRLPDIELAELDARRLPYRDEFDVVGAFDVLEHVREDEEILAGMRRAAQSGGGLIVLVPQHPRLWSDADVVARHVRRYTRRGLEQKVERAGFEIVEATSFVSLLLPAMVMSRGGRRALRCRYDLIAELRPGFLNGLFERILDGERKLIERGVSLPFGASLLLVGRSAQTP